MKSMFIKNILVIVICGIIIVSMGNIDRLPWWIFLLPVMIVGYGLTLLKWDLNAFMVGFISGFLIWFFGNLLFDVQYDGFIIAKMAGLLNVPKVLLFFFVRNYRWCNYRPGYVYRPEHIKTCRIATPGIGKF